MAQISEMIFKDQRFAIAYWDYLSHLLETRKGTFSYIDPKDLAPEAILHRLSQKDPISFASLVGSNLATGCSVVKGIVPIQESASVTKVVQQPKKQEKKPKKETSKVVVDASPIEDLGSADQYMEVVESKRKEQKKKKKESGPPLSIVQMMPGITTSYKIEALPAFLKCFPAEHGYGSEVAGLHVDRCAICASVAPRVPQRLDKRSGKMRARMSLFERVFVYALHKSLGSVSDFPSLNAASSRMDEGVAYLERIASPDGMSLNFPASANWCDDQPILTLEVMANRAFRLDGK
jgi:hypothetical protein